MQELAAADQVSPWEGSLVEVVLRPLHRWIWNDPARCVRKLVEFSETEADSARRMARAAELCTDAPLRRLLLRHALDEGRHAELFRTAAAELSRSVDTTSPGTEMAPAWLAEGERGLDDLEIEGTPLTSLLAFVHLSERAGAARFSAYRRVIREPKLNKLFGDVLKDEVFHAGYSRSQLERLAGPRAGRFLVQARLQILWRRYLRLTAAIATTVASTVFLGCYFLILPAFALLEKRTARREATGWLPTLDGPRAKALRSQV